MIRFVVRSIFGEAVSWLVFASLMLLAISALLAWRARERRAQRMFARDLALVDGAFGDQFPVELTIVVNDQRLGTDRGVLWFADRLMGFSGAASSFVLAASDVSVPILSIPEAKARKQSRERLHPVAVVLQNASRESQVTIGPLVGHEAAFRERLATFISADERPEGERFWPPLVPYRAFEEHTAALS